MLGINTVLMYFKGIKSGQRMFSDHNTIKLNIKKDITKVKRTH